MKEQLMNFEISRKTKKREKTQEKSGSRTWKKHLEEKE